MDTLAREPGGQMRGAATKAMSEIAEERQQRRYAPFAAAPRSPGGQQQSVHIISLQTLTTLARNYGDVFRPTQRPTKGRSLDCCNTDAFVRITSTITDNGEM